MPRPRLPRWLLVAFAVVSAMVGAWYAAHRVPGFGPFVADALRIVFGTEMVSRLQEITYGVEDRVHRITRRDERPKAYWAAPAPSTAAAPVEADAGLLFRPADVGALYSAIAAPGDGIWVHVPIPLRPNQPPLFYKTLLHPDRKRPWAELFVVAIDLKRAELHAAAGSVEPKPTRNVARSFRTGMIPEDRREKLVAAFNGGFKAEHGQYGMMVGGATLISPRPELCTVAGFDNGRVRIHTWKFLADDAPSMRFWRQCPPCLVEHGKIHAGMGEESTNWGAAVGGDTVIRRSALGIDREGNVLFMGVTNHTTARAIALGMKHAGAFDVAQLDINWSYPEFVLFRERAPGELEAFGLFEGFVFDKDEYLRKASSRDFFYLTLK